MDYEKLTKDLRLGKTLADLAAQGEDGGTANLDSFVLRLPRAREQKVLEAIRNAGCYCRKKRNWLGACYFITIGYAGQANANTRAVEAIYKHMKEEGYNASIFYQVD